MWVEQPLKRNTKKTKDTLSLLSTFSENLALRNQLLPDGARLGAPEAGPGGPGAQGWGLARGPSAPGTGCALGGVAETAPVQAL